MARKSKLKLKRGFSVWLDDALSRVAVKEAPFNFAVGAETLAATASVFHLTLMTADPQLIACPGIKTLADE